MALLNFIGVVAVMATSAMAAEHGSSSEMGPAAFTWPPDRVWTAAADNTAPCGSVDTVKTRTNFPLTQGQVSLVYQKEASNLELGISYNENPQSDNDFTPLRADGLAQLITGHDCVDVVDAPNEVKAGTKATLQLKYTSSFGRPESETFYACADIVYVDRANFHEKVFCEDHMKAQDGTVTGIKGISKAEPATSSAAAPGAAGMSTGTIAGIVMGVLGGIGLIAAAAFLIYRRKQQRLSMLRQQNSTRGVKWDQQTGDSQSNRSVRMQSLR